MTRPAHFTFPIARHWTGLARSVLAAALAALALATPISAGAHNFWLQPDTHTPEPGDQVSVDFKVGDIGAKATDWGLYWERIGALQMFGPGSITDQQVAVRTTTASEPGAALVAAGQPGTHILAFASNTSFSDLEADRFNRYVADQGLTAIAADRAARRTDDRSGTELYARRAKALIQVGDATTANVSKPIGQTLEIVPLANPFDYDQPGTLLIRVLWRGKPLEGASLMVARGGGEIGEERIVLTDASGMAEFQYDPADRYLLTVVWGEPAPNDGRADYYTIFSSLTF